MTSLAMEMAVVDCSTNERQKEKTKEIEMVA